MLVSHVTERFLAYCMRHRSPATVAFCHARLKKFCERFNTRELGTITSLEIDEHLAEAGAGLSDSTRHHDAVALGRLQKFALEHDLLEKPVFGRLEKPRVGQRERVPTAKETEAILERASPQFRLISQPVAVGSAPGPHRTGRACASPGARSGRRALTLPLASRASP
jgi:site-specific recombinase XerD